MPVAEQEKSEIAALSAKLSDVRSDNQAKDKELNELRNRVVKLEDKSPVDALKAENAQYAADLADFTARLADTEKQLAKANRDLASAGPAIALAEAVAAVRG